MEQTKPVCKPTPRRGHTGEVALGGAGLRFGFDFGFDLKSTIYFFPITCGPKWFLPKIIAIPWVKPLIPMQFPADSGWVCGAGHECMGSPIVGIWCIQVRSPMRAAGGCARKHLVAGGYPPSGALSVASLGRTEWQSQVCLSAGCDDEPVVAAGAHSSAAHSAPDKPVRSAAFRRSEAVSYAPPPPTQALFGPHAW